jgi:signal transduction histidine kinase
MRLAARLTLGSALATTLFAAGLATQTVILRQLARSSSDVAAVKLRASTAAVELLADLDHLEANARRFYVTRDPAYAGLVCDGRDRLAGRLDELAALHLDGSSEEALGAVIATWKAFRLSGVARPAMADELGGLDEGRLVEQVAQPLDRLHQGTLRLVVAIRRGIEADAVASVAASAASERLALAVALAATLVSAGILFLTIRTLRRRLDALTQGARAVAEGEFAYQLDAGGGDEFSEVAADFNLMVTRLGALDAMKHDFVSNVSHELRTPLVAMQETTRLLLEEVPGPLTGKQRRLLELNLGSAVRLGAMISNLLDLSRVQAGAPGSVMVARDLAEVIHAVVAELGPLQRERGIRITVKASSGVVVACDPVRIAQVVSNLIDNALKFSPPGEEVVVELGTGSDLFPVDRATAAGGPGGAGSAGLAVLRVTDHGPGIPPEHRTAVFERFRQLERTPRRGGVGLGLAISRKIVEAHGGTIWVEDGPTGGSAFVVALPLAQGSGTGASPKSAESEEGARE